MWQKQFQNLQKQFFKFFFLNKQDMYMAKRIHIARKNK